MTLKALDLFCGGGGACLGMQWAGFEVVGIDNKPHKNYPGTFIQADIHSLPVDPAGFDFVWASPPCQRFSIGTLCSKNKEYYLSHPDFIPITREILEGHPFSCIENVPRSPIRHDLVLNGPSVELNWILRKRIFELSFWVWGLHLPKPPVKPFTIAKCRSPTNCSDAKRRKEWGLPKTIPKEVAKVFMGIPITQEMTDVELGEAVPPPYSYYIAKQALEQING